MAVALVPLGALMLWLANRRELSSVDASRWRLTRAIKLHQAILAHRKRALGADHPHTLRCRHDIADTIREAGRADPFREAGRAEQAIALYEALLTGVADAAGDPAGGQHGRRDADAAPAPAHTGRWGLGLAAG